MSAFSNEAPFGLLEYNCSEIAALHLAKNSEGMNFDKLTQYLSREILEDKTHGYF